MTEIKDKLSKISPLRGCVKAQYAGDFALFGDRKFLKCINWKKIAHTTVSFVVWFTWIFSQRVMVVSGLDQLLEPAQGHGVYAGSAVIYKDDLVIGQIDTGTAGKFDHQETEISADEKAWAAIFWNGYYTTGIWRI